VLEFLLMAPDSINGLFELVGAVLTWGNVRRLYRDKQTKGVFWPAWGFFAAWGCWNIYYYAALAQWWSWGAGILLASANVLWISMAAYYNLSPQRPSTGP
jgi:hypothetical protein